MMCPRHPKYQGVHRPRTTCPDCWAVYGNLHPETLAGKYMDAIRTGDGGLRSRQITALLMVLSEKTLDMGARRGK